VRQAQVMTNNFHVYHATSYMYSPEFCAVFKGLNNLGLTGENLLISELKFYM